MHAHAVVLLTSGKAIDHEVKVRVQQRISKSLFEERHVTGTDEPAAVPVSIFFVRVADKEARFLGFDLPLCV